MYLELILNEVCMQLGLETCEGDFYWYNCVAVLFLQLLGYR